MLAAVLKAGESPESLRERLANVGHIAGLADPKGLITEHGGIMVWAEPGLSGLDARAQSAWVGEIRGALPTTTDDDFSKLGGDFGLVALRGDALVLVRGRFGGRPLYYAHDAEGDIVVCSRLAPLLRMLGRSRTTIDVQRLAAVILTETRRDFFRTVYEGVSRVSSGEIVVVNPRGTRVSPRSPLRQGTSIGSSEEAVFELRKRLLRTVDRATRGARRVAVCVSGGVDSSAILGAAVALVRGASQRDADLVGLSLDYGGFGDDRPYREALIRSLGIVTVRMAASDFAAPGPRTTVVDGAPFPWPTGDAHVRLLQRARALGADVVLTGEMGDDIFGGDLRVFAATAHAGRPFAGLYGAVSLQGTWLRSPFERLTALFLRPLVGRIFGPAPSWMAKKMGGRSFAWAGPALRAVQKGVWSDSKRTSTVQILSGQAREETLGGALYHLDLSDTRGQYELKTGCHIVHVPLDEEVADFVASLPARFLFHGGYHRGLLREASRGWVPDFVRLRPDKAGALGLLEPLFQAPGCAQAIEPLLSMRTLADLGLVQPKRFAAELGGFPRTLSSKTKWMEIWPAIVAEDFARRILEGADWPIEKTVLNVM